MSHFQVQLNKEKGDSDDVTPESSEVGGGTLMCVARRIPQNEKSVGTPIEQFTMKLDTSGKIVGIDTIGVSATYSQYLNKVRPQFLVKPGPSGAQLNICLPFKLREQKTYICLILFLPRLGPDGSDNSRNVPPTRLTKAS